MKEDQRCEPDLTPIWVTIYYDPQLRAITGKAKERAMVNRGCYFGFVLESVLISYSEIRKKYPPGILGFTLNGQPPDLLTPLKDGDLLCLLVCNDLSEKLTSMVPN